MSLVRQGRVWKFGDNINTDLIFPNTSLRLKPEEQHRLVFSANRPGWVDQVKEGDLIIAGANFGMGSGRSVGQPLRACGIAGVLAESVNGLCQRTCIAVGFPTLSIPGILAFFEEGDEASIDFRSGELTNLTSGQVKIVKPLPDLFCDFIINGGIIPMLVREGWIEPEPIARAESR